MGNKDEDKIPFESKINTQQSLKPIVDLRRYKPE